MLLWREGLIIWQTSGPCAASTGDVAPEGSWGAQQKIKNCVKCLAAFFGP